MKNLLWILMWCFISTNTWSGYSEINSVGDVVEAKNMPEPQSTVTNSPVVSILSESSEYYIPETTK